MPVGLGSNIKMEALHRLSQEIRWMSPVTLDLPSLHPGLGGTEAHHSILSSLGKTCISFLIMWLLSQMTQTSSSES